MSGRNYYSLVAGLREYALDADTKGFDAKGIVEEILGEVSASDASEVRLLYGYYDCENILALRAAVRPTTRWATSRARSWSRSSRLRGSFRRASPAW